MKSIFALRNFLICATLFSLIFAPAHAEPVAFKTRKGYKVSLAADKVKEARFLETDGRGNVFVSQPTAGAIVVLHAKSDGTYEQASEFVTGFKQVQAMQFREGWLWFAQSGAILKARVKENGEREGEVVAVIPEGELPSGGGHWFRSLLVTSDYIYTSIGDSGNLTDETATDRQKIWRYTLDGKNKTFFASGIRNTEKLLFRPGTHEIWGCDHGSDRFGKNLGEVEGKNQPVTDSNPPDEFNHYIQGGFYGHPFVVGNRIPRLEFQNRSDILDLVNKTIEPAWCFGAHWACNSFCFLTKDFFPGHKGDALVAFHGSWDRIEKAGYQIARVLFDPETGLPYGLLTIVSTLASDGTVLARPVDCLEMPDGSVLFSADSNHSIYRLTRDE